MPDQNWNHKLMLIGSLELWLLNWVNGVMQWRLWIMQKPSMKNWLLHWTKMNRLYINLGMISHKKSLMTNFGLKHYMQKFHQKFDIFRKKNSLASDFSSHLVWNCKFWSKNTSKNVFTQILQSLYNFIFTLELTKLHQVSVTVPIILAMLLQSKICLIWEVNMASPIWMI